MSIHSHVCPLRFLELAGNLQDRGILALFLQSIRAQGPLPLPTPGCLQTKLWSHFLAHPYYCLDQRLWFPERSPWHRFPNSEMVRSRRVLRGCPVHFPSGVGPSSPNPAPKILSCKLLYLTWVLLLLKMGAPYRPRTRILCALQRIRKQAGVRGSSGTGLGEESS